MSPEKPRYTQKRSVESYFKSFDTSDVQAVTDMALYISQTKQNITKIIVHTPNDRQDKLSTVYLEENTPQGAVWTQANWSDPGLPPCAYDRYAHDFYGFSGPQKIQLNRALLLANVLQVPAIEADDLPSGVLQILHLGVIMLKNPLKENPFGATINTGSHVLRIGKQAS